VTTHTLTAVTSITNPIREDFQIEIWGAYRKHGVRFLRVRTIN